MKGISNAVTALLLGGTVMAAQAGISLGQTRVIFPASSKGVPVMLSNRGAEVYLIQAAVTDWQTNKPSSAFTVIPPLFRLEGNSNNVLRVSRTGGDLPVDRESVFHFRINAIPAGSAPSVGKDAPAASVSVALGMGIKLLYRPDELGMTPAQAWERVSFTREGGDVSVDNPTPYYQTFAQLTFDGRPVDLDRSPAMLAPYSKTRYPAGGSVKKAVWSFITDYGSSSPQMSAAIR